MNQLRSIAEINDGKLKIILDKIATEEIINIGTPCYFPSPYKYYPELLQACGLKKQDVEDFAERTWSGRPEGDRRALSERINLFSTWLMWYLLDKQDSNTFKSALIYHLLRQYGMLGRHYFSPSPCNPDAFMYALETISKTHLFIKKGNIPGAIIHLSNELEKRFAAGIKNWSLNSISHFITESNRRLNQSLKSFSTAYYKYYKGGKPFGTSLEQDGEEVIPPPLDRLELLTIDIARCICTQGQIDQKALNDAKKITEIKMSMAMQLVNELSNSARSGQYFDDVKFVLELFLKAVSVKGVSVPGYVDFVGDLMRIKRTTKAVYFKKQVSELLVKLIKNIGIERDFKKYTKQTQFLVSAFLAHYIIMVLRNAFPDKGN